MPLRARMQLDAQLMKMAAAVKTLLGAKIVSVRCN